jgi:class 3 adenylate cyclase
VTDDVVAPDAEPAELEAVGLYDPSAPDADDRLEMLRLAIELGATVDEMHVAIAENRLHAIPAERVLQGGTERLTLDEAMQRSGIDPELGRRVWRAFGFVEGTPDALLCSERDVDLFGFFQLAEVTFGLDAALALVRTVGSAMARLADNDISSARSVVEAPIRSEGGTSADIAKTFVEVAQTVVPTIYPMLETVHRHHLVNAGRRYSAWGLAPNPQQTSDAVVGFADLVGYTALTQHISPEELEHLVGGFEETALAATARPGARLVKTIGDEAMFVAGSARDAVEIAHRLVDDPDLPPLRIGLAAGEIVTRDGDVFGSVVNLAARLVGIAEPEQILCDAETALRFEGLGGAAVSLGPTSLRGFDEPVEVFAIR